MDAEGFNYTPLGENVVVKADDREEKTAGGLYIPETTENKEKTTHGVVVATGTDVAEGVLDAGDKVVYNTYAGVEYEVDGESVLVMQIHEIVLKENAS